MALGHTNLSPNNTWGGLYQYVQFSMQGQAVKPPLLMYPPSRPSAEAATQWVMSTASVSLAGAVPQADRAGGREGAETLDQLLVEVSRGVMHHESTASTSD